jgi:hypothetical protein
MAQLQDLLLLRFCDRPNLGNNVSQNPDDQSLSTRQTGQPRTGYLYINIFIAIAIIHIP